MDKNKLGQEDVSIVICAYNEKDTIANVVKKCRKFNPKSEIIVVDDGSDDGTMDILDKLQHKVKFKNFRLPDNKGKSNAMITGVLNAGGEIILFFDADVKGIRKRHFSKLLKPLFDRKDGVDMVLGSPSETLINYKVNPFKGLTGERALYRKDILPLVDDIRNIQFGIETYLNLYYQANGRTIKYQMLEGLEHPTKYDKTSAVDATKEFINEGREIAATLLHNTDLITQIIGNNFREKSEEFRDKIREQQNELNEKIKDLLNIYE